MLRTGGWRPFASFAIRRGPGGRLGVAVAFVAVILLGPEARALSCSFPSDCDDADPCTANDCAAGNCRFDPIPGCCVTASDCADSNACTDEACVGGSCSITFGTGPCDDGSSCTNGDACAGGVCAGAPEPDGDGDGACDAVDNCLSIANPDQANADGDAFGDACDSGASQPLYFVDTPFDPPVESRIFALNPATGALTLRANLGTAYAPILGLAAATGSVLYAAGSDNTGGTICAGANFSCLLLRIELDPASTAPLSVTVVGPFRGTGTPIEGFTGLTFRSDGVLYGISENTNGLYTLDLVTGTATLVGISNVDIQGGDLTFDAFDRLWLWENGGAASQAGLYLLNPATGQANLSDPEGVNLSGLAGVGHTNVLYGTGAALDRVYDVLPVTGMTGSYRPITLGGAPFDHKRGDLDSPFCADAAVCDDADACTVDRCTAGGCEFLHLDATCDAVDDDCDASIDEDYVGTPTSCGVGACASSGVTTCTAGIVEDSCTAGSPTGVSEAVCNGIDDDCDGLTDEDFAATPTSCGVGACASSGVRTCTAGGLGDTCAPGSPTGTIESICNGVDDDCDALTDEDYAPTPTTCGGPGVCSAAGGWVCVGGVLQDTCTPGQPAMASVPVDFGTATRYRANVTGPPEDIVLVAVDSAMRFLANGTDPGIDMIWTAEGFDDSGWASGTHGVGYETAPPGASALLRTVVPEGTHSVFTRSTFTVADKAAIRTLLLGADYDDGWIAWINGVEVARSANMPEGSPAWDTSPEPHESSNGATPDYGRLEDVTPAALPVLRDGANVLAMAVWNADAASSTDLVLVPKLAIGLEWTQHGYDDASWSTGEFGIGYELAPPGAAALIRTIVPAGTVSVLTRTSFQVANPSAVREMLLGADYDAGYKVWINGVEVYASPEVGPSTLWDAIVTAHESSNGSTPDYGAPIDLSVLGVPALRAGANVLAIQVWNSDPAAGSDLVVVPRLSLGEAETCDGLDNDCDGPVDEGYPDLDGDGVADCVDPDDDGDGVHDASDCAPADPGSTGPLGEVTGVAWSRHPTLLRWAEQGEGVLYDVVIGTLAGLRADGGATGATCLADGLPIGMLDDALAAPAPGAAYYYLVRAQKTSCATGRYGAATSGAERLPAADCP